MELQESTENVNPINLSDSTTLLFNQPINTSTPIKLNSFSIQGVQLFNDDLSSEKNLSLTKSSDAPSLPSGLLEIVGDDWMNEAEPIEKLGMLSAKEPGSDNKNTCSDSTPENTCNNISISPTSQDSVNDNAGMSCIYFDHDYAFPKCKSSSANVDNISNCSDTTILSDHDEINTLSTCADTDILSTDNESDGLSICTDTESVVTATDSKTKKIDLDTLKLQTSRHPSMKMKQKEVVCKQYYCHYCKILVTKYARHLESHHKNMPEVKKFLTYPPKSLKRKEAISEIRNQASYLHNTSEKYNTGTLITSRRPQPGYNRTGSHYEFCVYCKLALAGTSLHKHEKKCRKNTKKMLLNNKDVVKYRKT